MSDLEKVGLLYIAQDADKFIEAAERSTDAVNKLNKQLLTSQGVNAYGKVMGSASESNNDAAKSFAAVEKASLSFFKSSVLAHSESAQALDGFIQQNKGFVDTTKHSIQTVSKFNTVLMKIAPAAGTSSTGIFRLVGQLKYLNPKMLAAAAAIGAFYIGNKLMHKLGERASAYGGIVDSLEAVSEKIGGATKLMGDLRVASGGMVSDIKMMTEANKALTGTTQLVSQEFSKTLPVLMEFARARAGATGEDVETIFSSTIEGIRKARPMALETVGLVMDLDEIYGEYAKSIGKATTELSKNEKQLAMIKSVTEATKASIEEFGGVSLSTADKIQALGVTNDNLLDKMSMSIQGIFSVFIDLKLGLANAFSGFLEPFLNLFTAVNDFVGKVIRSIGYALEPVFNMILSIWNFVKTILNDFNFTLENVFPIIDIIAGAFRVLFEVFNGVASVINFVSFLLKSFMDAFGPLVSALFRVIITPINFLISAIQGIFEPLQGMFDGLGVTIDSIKERITMGLRAFAIGGARMIGALGRGIQTAAASVIKVVADLAKSIADFLVGQSPPPKGPLSIIDKGGYNTMQAWLDGFVSVPLKPVEDVAREVQKALGGIANATLEEVDERIKQLEASIKPFEDKLTIMEERFNSIKAPAEAAMAALEKQSKAAVLALMKGDQEALNTVRSLDAKRASLESFLSKQEEEITNSRLQLTLAKAKNADELTLLRIRRNQLSEQMKINQAINKEPLMKSEGVGSSGAASSGASSREAPEVKKLSFGKGGQAADVISNNNEEIEDAILDNSFEEFLFQEMVRPIEEGNEILNAETSRLGSEVGRLSAALNGENIASRFTEAFANIGTDIETILSDIGVRIQGSFESVVNWFVNKDEEGTFAYALANLGDNAAAWLEPLVTSFSNLGNDISTALSSVVIWLTDMTTEGTLAFALANLSVNVATWLEPIAGFFQTMVDDITLIIQNVIMFLTDASAEGSLPWSLKEFFTGEGPNTLSGIITFAANLFKSFFDFAFGAEGLFANLRGVLQNILVDPVIAVLNTLIDGINMLISAVETVINTILGALDNIKSAIPGLSDLFGDIPTISFQRIGKIEVGGGYEHMPGSNNRNWSDFFDEFRNSGSGNYSSRNSTPLPQSTNMSVVNNNFNVDMSGFENYTAATTLQGAAMTTIRSSSP